MKKFLMIIICFLFITGVKAYENEYFKINIPENYILNEETQNNIYKWTYENNYIAITIGNNLELKYNLLKFNDEDIANQKEYLEKSINNNLEKYNVTANVTNIYLSEDKTKLYYDIYYPSKDATGYDIYQKGIMYTTNKYIVNVIYSSDNEILEDNEEYNNVFSSIEILDSNIKDINYSTYISIIVVLGIILGIIGYLLSLKKRK